MNVKKKLSYLLAALGLLPLLIVGLWQRPFPTASAETAATNCYNVYLPMIISGSNNAKPAAPDGDILPPQPTGNECPTGDAFPDFNGDGYGDLAIGVPDEDVQQGLNYENAGAVHVIYGSATGLEANVALAVVNDQLWHRAVDGLDDIAVDTDDAFGAALALGDFNNDGFDDLAIGVPGSTVSGETAAGAVQVLYGTADGLTTADSQTWTQDSVLIIDEANQDDNFGAALTAGDYNGDGFSDLAVGIPNEMVGGDANAGAVAIIYGSDDGLQSTWITANPDDFLTQDTPGFLASPAEANDRFGTTLTTGDFNGDNVDDLAVGTPFEENGAGFSNAGAVQIFLGSSDYGIVDEFNGVVNAMHIRADTAGVDNTMEAGEFFGYSLSAGNFDGDAYDDLAIGTPHETHGAGADALQFAGAVNIVYGSASGLDPAAGAPIFHQDVAGIKGEAAEFELFGFRLTAADFNNDGYTDLAAGVPYDNDPAAGIIPIGSVHILRGSENGLTEAFDQQIFDPDNPEEDDAFGFAVTAVDANGDGYPELVVGAYLDDPAGVAADNIGSIFIFTSDGDGVAQSDNQTFYQGYGGVAGAQESDDHMGESLP
ncbi:FG-GAP-like repeat-containing protein [Candidatus Leptofilum sp.]|uniref:FG-GAP-like repeat-containing protein n=1 Tax=Candidatus Leptofilum sp. TaxID=3241576 RepID=UPI003B5AC2D6